MHNDCKVFWAWLKRYTISISFLFLNYLCLSLPLFIITSDSVTFWIMLRLCLSSFTNMIECFQKIDIRYIIFFEEKLDKYQYLSSWKILSNDHWEDFILVIEKKTYATLLLAILSRSERVSSESTWKMLIKVHLKTPENH